MRRGVIVGEQVRLKLVGAEGRERVPAPDLLGASRRRVPSGRPTRRVWTGAPRDRRRAVDDGGAGEAAPGVCETLRRNRWTFLAGRTGERSIYRATFYRRNYFFNFPASVRPTPVDDRGPSHSTRSERATPRPRWGGRRESEGDPVP